MSDKIISVWTYFTVSQEFFKVRKTGKLLYNHTRNIRYYTESLCLSKTLSIYYPFQNSLKNSLSSFLINYSKIRL